MTIYEAMGDALAQQYGGSAAHSKVLFKSYTNHGEKEWALVVG